MCKEAFKEWRSMLQLRTLEPWRRWSEAGTHRDSSPTAIQTCRSRSAGTAAWRPSGPAASSSWGRTGQLMPPRCWRRASETLGGRYWSTSKQTLREEDKRVRLEWIWVRQNLRRVGLHVCIRADTQQSAEGHTEALVEVMVDPTSGSDPLGAALQQVQKQRSQVASDQQSVFLLQEELSQALQNTLSVLVVPDLMETESQRYYNPPPNISTFLQLWTLHFSK